MLQLIHTMLAFVAMRLQMRLYCTAHFVRRRVEVRRANMACLGHTQPEDISKVCPELTYWQTTAVATICIRNGTNNQYHTYNENNVIGKSLLSQYSLISSRLLSRYALT